MEKVKFNGKMVIGIKVSFKIILLMVLENIIKKIKMVIMKDIIKMV